MLCNVMDSKKLSLEACAHAAQNERLPMRVVVQVLFMEQMQLRAAIMGCLDGTTPRNSAATPDIAAAGRHPPSTCEHQADQDHHQPDILEGGRLSVADKNGALDTSAGGELLTTHVNHVRDALVGGGGRWKLSTTTQLNQHGFLSAHESQTLRTDLVGLRRRIGELERECSRLRSHLRRKATGWASLSAKLTCQSISDISDMSGQLQHVPRSRRRAVTSKPSPHPSRPRLSSPSWRPPLTSSSSSTHSLYTPSPKFH